MAAPKENPGMPTSRRLAVPFAGVLTALVTVACGDNLSTGQPAIREDLTIDIGATARDEVEAALSALTLSSSIDPLGTAQAPTSPASPQCVSPSTPADSDGDGIPDDAVYIFTAPPCRFIGWRGGTLDVTGQFRIQDPAPSQAGFGYDGTLTGLRTRFTTSNNEVIYDVTRNGTRVLSGSTAGLLLSTDLQVIRTFPGKPDGAIDQKWSVTYAPGAPLQINLPVPSGTLDIAGSFNWTRGTESFVLTVTTPSPLHYNANCNDTVQRIDSGALHVAGTFGEVTGYVLVRWSRCGEEPRFNFVSTE
jgi:hypothetical protein